MPQTAVIRYQGGGKALQSTLDAGSPLKIMSFYEELHYTWSTSDR